MDDKNFWKGLAEDFKNQAYLEEFIRQSILLMLKKDGYAPEES